MSEAGTLPSKSVRHIANTLTALGIKFAFVGAVNPKLDREFVLTTFADYADLLEVPERVTQLEALLG